MGNVRWKANEIEFLKENYGILKLEEIAKQTKTKQCKEFDSLNKYITSILKCKTKRYLQLKEKLKEMVLNQLENGQMKK